MPLVAIEHKRTQRGHKKHLVGIPDKTVGLFQAGDQLPMPPAEADRASMRGIDVQPHFMPTTDIRDVLQRVEGAHWGGTGTADDRHNRPLLGPQSGQQLVQPLGIDAVRWRSSRAARTTWCVPNPRMPAERAMQ